MTHYVILLHSRGSLFIVLLLPKRGSHSGVDDGRRGQRLRFKNSDYGYDPAGNHLDKREGSLRKHEIKNVRLT